jgi:hypothetical protein
MKLQTDQMFEILMEGPDVIYDYIEKQRIFREVYLKNDLEVEI